MNQKVSDLISSYKMPDEAVKLIKETKIVLLVGTAGAGKNTVLAGLLKKPDYQFIVSHTTRPPRKNRGQLEKNGVNYHFINFDRAETMLENGEFIEAKNVHGKVYGTSIKAIEDIKNAGKTATTDLDIQGVEEYKAVSPSVVAVFLLPPDFETWQKRLASRYGEEDDENDLKQRMKTAETELQEALDKDYFEFVINDDLDRTVRAVDEIAHGELSAEKNEQSRTLAWELLDKLKNR